MSKILLILITTVFKSICFATEVTLYTEDSPPLNYVNKMGKLEGFAVALVDEMKSRLKSKIPIVVLPWDKAYSEALMKPNVALFSTTKTEEREKLFKWVGPLVSTYWVFVTKRDSIIKINSLNDAKKAKSVGVYKSDAREQILIKEGFKNIVAANDDKENLLKLLKGDIDVWFTSEDIAIYHLDSHGARGIGIEITYIYKKEDLYLAFSKFTKDSIVAQWREAFENIRKDGTYNILAKKNRRMLRTGRSL